MEFERCCKTHCRCSIFILHQWTELHKWRKTAFGSLSKTDSQRLADFYSCRSRSTTERRRAARPLKRGIATPITANSGKIIRIGQTVKR